jgi:hypothetical protein
MKGLDGNRLTAGEEAYTNWLIAKHQNNARALGIIVREQEVMLMICYPPQLKDSSRGNLERITLGKSTACMSEGLESKTKPNIYSRPLPPSSCPGCSVRNFTLHEEE